MHARDNPVYWYGKELYIIGFHENTFFFWSNGCGRRRRDVKAYSAKKDKAMDSWEWNKYAAAVLSALVFVLAVHFVANAVFSIPAPSRPGYVPPVPEATAPPPKTDDAAAGSAGADAQTGAKPAAEKK